MNISFEKIDVVKPSHFSDVKYKNKKWLKITGIVIGSLIVIVIIGLLIALAPAKKTYAEALKAYSSAMEAYGLVKKQDIISAGDKLKETKENLLATNKSLSALSWTSYLPIIGNYYRDGKHALNASLEGIDAGIIITEAIKPHADLLGLKGQGSFVLGSAEERIQKTVQTMNTITPELDKVEVKLKNIKKEIDQIDPNRYPQEFRGKLVRSQIFAARNLIDGSSKAISQAKPLIKAIPSLLGEPASKKYLILFQNDKELRSTGGFITAYAVFRMEHGKAYAEISEDIYKLDSTRTYNLPAPKPIISYLPNVPYWYLRDSNISPDYVESMKNFETIYKTVSEKINYDGIIAIDTHVLSKILEVLGPIEVSGITFDNSIVPGYNCSKVIYELEKYADERVGYIKTDRKDIIGKLMYSIMQKSLSSSPRLYWGRLFQVGIDELSQKHILIYLHDKEAQKGAEAMNYAGRIREYDGNYLHINDTNFAGAKSNMYVKEEVNQKVERQSDGSLVSTIAIKYTNPQPPSDCSQESGKLCLNGELRNWLRIYVPKGSQLLTSKGSIVKVASYDDLGKTVFDGFLIVRPQGSVRFEISYKLPFVSKDGQEINELIQKQPGTEGNKYTIEGKGKTQEFNLTLDKEIKIKL